VEKCICGFTVGHAKARYASPARTTVAIVYRFAKYAILPHHPLVKPPRYPLSAFIFLDMMELVSAHASHHFAILDEEDDKIRILIWLFNPSIKLSYAMTTCCGIPQEGTIHAAKVFYRLVGAGENVVLHNLRLSDPDFAQAEHLSYPLSICHSIAALLTASNRAYPAGYRMMDKLQMGWLQRSSLS